MKNPTDRYFAARTKDTIGQSLANRLEEEQSNKDNALPEVYATAYEHYYGLDLGRGPTFAVTRGGKAGELAEIRIAKARAVAKSFLSLIIGPKVNWRPQAANSSPGAAASTILANNLLEWAWKKNKLARRYAIMAEMGILAGEGFVAPLWDTTLGPIIGLADDGTTPQRGGDIRYRNFLPWDVVRSGQARAYEDTQWKFLRVWENKWDVMRLHPQDVLGEPTRDRLMSVARDEQMNICTPISRNQSDVIPVWYFFHDPCPSLPFGMEVVFTSANCVLRYRRLTYGTQDERKTPLVRFALDELFGTPYGYSGWWDTLAPQELMDGLETAIATNQLTLATQSVAFEQGTDIRPDAVTGMQAFVVPKGAMVPQGVQLTKSPPEVFSHIKQKTMEQQQLMNLNDTFRGQPDTAQMNAQAFTVLATQAIAQNGPAQSAALDAVAELGTMTLQTMAQRVTDERKLRITGKQSKYLYSEQDYSGKSLKCISEVFVEIGNPIEQTAAGRLTIAQMYQGAKQANGQPVSVEQLQQVIDTGRLEPVTGAGRDTVMLIESENERMSSGEPVQAHALDDHLLHGRENIQPILNPEGRRDAKVNSAVNEHIHSHYCLHFGVPPMDGVTAYECALQDPMYSTNIRILLGQMPPAPPQAPGAPPEGGEETGDVLAQPGGAPALPPLPPAPPPPQAADPMMQPSAALPPPPLQ